MLQKIATGFRLNSQEAFCFDLVWKLIANQRRQKKSGFRIEGIKHESTLSRSSQPFE